MNEDKSNIFENVANNEDRLTALFVNFLHYKEFLEAFLKISELETYIGELKGNNFEVQYYTDAYGIPDIRLYASALECLFEVKVNCYQNLTENQPCSYLYYLNSSNVNDKRIFLLAPRNYKHKSVFVQKCKEGGIRYMVISWEQVIALIQDRELDLLSPLFAEYLTFLKSWFEQIDYSNLNIERMYDRGYAESLRLLFTLVEQIHKNIGDQLNKGKLQNKMPNEYGFYVNQGTHNEIYFGIWLPFWESYGCPLVIASNQKDLSEILDGNVLPNLYVYNDFSGWFTIGIPKSYIPGVDEGTSKLEELLLKVVEV